MNLETCVSETRAFVRENCPTCAGVGRLGDAACHRCNGTGRHVRHISSWPSDIGGPDAEDFASEAQRTALNRARFTLDVVVTFWDRATKAELLRLLKESIRDLEVARG